MSKGSGKLVRIKPKKSLGKTKHVSKFKVKPGRDGVKKLAKRLKDDSKSSALSRVKKKSSTKKLALEKVLNGNVSDDEVEEIKEDDDSEYNSEEEMDSDKDEAEKHKRDLEKLKKSDPEFYQFLQKNDEKLLQFNVSDEETEEVADDDVHVPGEKLEVASDESDFEGDEGTEPKDSRVITLKMLKAWQEDIRIDKSNKTILALIHAFHAALCRVASDEADEEPALYIVEGATVFNGVIQLCVLELGPAVRRFLRLQPGSKQPPHRCKRFIKVKKFLKSYFADLLQLLQGVTSSSIQTVLLKHFHYLSNFLESFPNITKSLTKQLISLWGTGDDSVRVLAFFCILRITSSQQSSILDTVLKTMYMTYVKNSKFVSLKSLPVINFMRRSLVEMYALDTNISYQYVFLYIRQLVIHLRNAITVKKKENTQAVYNWQFINSLRLWGNLLTVTYNKTTMQQLIYPFVQVCLGTIKLVPTAQYYPLRFHVLQILTDLQRDTGVFVPILPFLLEILTTFDFNKKHQRVSMKPLHLMCQLRMSKSQLQENGFKDAVVESVYALLLEYLTEQSHTLAFPDLSLICVTQIKLFLKRCRNPNYTRKLKQLLEKIEQNCQFIETERSKVTTNIADHKQIEGWEAQIQSKGTPLLTYYESWNKLRTIHKNKQLTRNDELADYKLPTINRAKKTKSKNAEGPVELFPSDSEDEAGENLKRKRGKRGGKNVSKRTYEEPGPVMDDGEGDIVEDINIDDW